MIAHQSETGSQAASRRSLPDPRSVLMGRQVRWSDGSNIDLVLPSKASGALDELSVVLGLRDASAFPAALVKMGSAGERIRRDSSARLRRFFNLSEPRQVLPV